MTNTKIPEPLAGSGIILVKLVFIRCFVILPFRMTRQRLAERILGGVVVALREVVVDLVHGDAHVLENLPEILALMAEHDGAVVRVVLLDEDMTVEAAHVLDTEDTDAAERTGSHGDDLTLSDVGAELGVGRRLQTIDSSQTRLDVALERTVGHLNRQSASHDTLEAHLAVADLRAGGVTAVEAHEDFLLGIGVAGELLALDALLVHILRHGVVDVEQRHSILTDAGADVLRQCAVDIDLASHGYATTRQTAVHIAGNEAEHGLEGRPALVGHSHELA